jgi:molybdopterin molybdotransferase
MAQVSSKLDSSIQRITRLTPLDAVLANIESRVAAVKPQKSAVADARGFVLAEDVAASEIPAQPIALRDGYAVDSAVVADAGPCAPAPLASVPPRVDAGEPLPKGADTVLPIDAVMLRGGRFEAVAAVAPGEGVLAAGEDAMPRMPLLCAGARLGDVSVAAIAAARIAEVTVRKPRLRIVCSSAVRTPSIDAALAMLIGFAVKGGAVVSEEKGALEQAVTDDQADAVIAIGGTGSGRRDSAIQTLSRLGHLEAHGIAISPGETAALGFAGERPVLLVPGRLDAALAVWLLMGRHLLAKLAGGRIEDLPAMMPLKRKVTSTIGMTELIPVRSSGDLAEPLGSAYLSFTALARSDGWITVPADSEGFREGAQVAVRPWP